MRQPPTVNRRRVRGQAQPSFIIPHSRTACAAFCFDTEPHGRAPGGTCPPVPKEGRGLWGSARGGGLAGLTVRSRDGGRAPVSLGRGQCDMCSLSQPPAGVGRAQCTSAEDKDKCIMNDRLCPDSPNALCTSGASNGQGAVSALGSGRACPTAVIAFCPSCKCTALSQYEG